MHKLEINHIYTIWDDCIFKVIYIGVDYFVSINYSPNHCNAVVTVESFEESYYLNQTERELEDITNTDGGYYSDFFNDLRYASDQMLVDNH